MKNAAPKLFFIVNPQASGYSAELETLVKRSFEEADYKLEFTKEQGDGAILVAQFAAQSAATQRPMILIAVGGDGLVCEVVTAAAEIGADAAEFNFGLVVIPTGTANIFAEEIGSSGDLPSVIARLKELQSHFSTAKQRKVDLARVNGKLFALRLNIGLFAQTTTKNNATLKKRWGRLSYFLSFLENLTSGRNFRASINFTDERGRHRRKKFSCLSLTVTNAGATGVAGLHISQQIRIDDGLLDLVVFRRLWLQDLLSWIFKLVTRSNRPASASKHYQCQSLTITLRSREKVEVVVDDKLTAGSQFEIEVVPRAVKILN